MFRYAERYWEHCKRRPLVTVSASRDEPGKIRRVFQPRSPYFLANGSTYHYIAILKKRHHFINSLNYDSLLILL